MKSPAKPPSASRPSTLVPTTLLSASPPTRSATAKWTARTARTRVPSAVTLAPSRLPVHRFASDPHRKAARPHVRAHASLSPRLLTDHCSAVASTSAPLVRRRRPLLKMLSEFFYPPFFFFFCFVKNSDLNRQMSVGGLSESLPCDLNEHNMFRFIFEFP